MSRWGLLLACTIIAVCAVMAERRALAQAGADDAAARAHFNSGQLYFERGEYESALREFRSAYELSHRSVLLYNMSLSHERLGQHAEAADVLEQYLNDDETIEAERRATLNARLTNLRERAAAQSAQARQDEPPSEQRAPPEDGDLSALGVAAIVTLATAGASLLTFAITGGMALAEDGALADSCGENAGRACTEEQVSTLRTLTTVADATMVIGLVLAAAGGTLLVIDLLDAPSDESLAITPALSPTFAGLSLRGTL